MTEDTPDYSDCTEKQREVLRRLPATSQEIADEIGISRAGVVSRIGRIRECGYEVLHDAESGNFYLPVEDPDLPEKTDKVATAPREDIVEDLRDEGLTYADFEERYELSDEQARRLIEDLKQSGYALDFKVTDSQGTRLWYIERDRDKRFRVGDGDGVYRFALIGDTHLGSKAEHLRELHDFYDRVQAEGIEHVYHAGDITDGWEVYRGQINEVKGGAAGWERMLNYTVENYPQREGVSTLFIEGNHDRKYHRKNGLHLGELIARRRRDLHYCGDSQATFVFDAENDIDMELIHPSGGKPYTQGYRLQTLYRERPAEERPTLAGVGHLHGKLFADAEDVAGFYVGCWKGLTTYGKRKGHDSNIGGWIVEIEIEDGELRRISPDWIGYESRDESPQFNAEDIDAMTSE